MVSTPCHQMSHPVLCTSILLTSPSDASSSPESFIMSQTPHTSNIYPTTTIIEKHSYNRGSLCTDTTVLGPNTYHTTSLMSSCNICSACNFAQFLTQQGLCKSGLFYNVLILKISDSAIVKTKVAVYCPC